MSCLQKGGKIIGFPLNLLEMTKKLFSSILINAAYFSFWTTSSWPVTKYHNFEVLKLNLTTYSLIIWSTEDRNIYLLNYVNILEIIPSWPIRIIIIICWFSSKVNVYCPKYIIGCLRYMRPWRRYLVQS